MEIMPQNTYNDKTTQSQDNNKDKKNKLGKVSIILAVILVVGVAVGTYFILVSDDSESDENGMKTFTNSHHNKSPDTVLSKEVSESSTNMTSAPIETDYEGKNGSVFKTDPVCRDLAKSSVFIFDCYHQNVFNDLPDNSTVKCLYLQRVGSCIQALLEEEYEVDCDLLDQMVLLNLNADMILERSNFDVKTECEDWYDFYKKTVGGIKEGMKRK